MEAGELRVGNIVQLNPEKKWYPEHRVLIVKSIGSDGINIGYEQYVGRTVIQWEDIAPIPLTEEWLLKFGFEPTKGKEPIMFTNGKYNYFPSYKYFGRTRNNGGLIHSDVKHVHQLQNLYFALTGEELIADASPPQL